MSTNHLTPIPRSSGSTGQLVRAAREGDQGAWRRLVERYDSMVRRSATRVRGLTAEDYDDVVATTWLRFVDDIHRLRHPAAAVGWLKTTAYRESLRLAAARRRSVCLNAELSSCGGWVDPDLGDEMMCDEIRRLVAAAMADLSPTGQRLLTALMDDPHASYKDIEARHGIVVGSIGPIRGRILRKLEVALGEIGVTVPGSHARAA